ncbi:putative glutamate--cysteine ligase 2 [Actinoplanes lobatus]|uniref:Putative glutamate--cysteine ligase 2 n=1 Tax=Actinoplanes lobatus TaxID=113568 RepID=A0A7W7MKF8_9ACTN|nr:YbdK family carboxylate-amine ligase [Actinoplanes lobatus]MBB4753604.1 carboxylate-amine ligase [Actinoplanes lobatus]GGN84548.1 putative glutamate--cysteine ligase 2 [Actinoplanes lobatus]GIE38141.1 putative glutamate--cysteine ligase 2 [Actinoplanes lobatus]
MSGDIVTLRVEEDFLLLDPAHGWPTQAAPALLDSLRGLPGPHADLMRYQISATTPECSNAAGLSRELHRARDLLATGAHGLGCELVASGTAPYGAHGLSTISDLPRYRALALRYPALAARSGVCGCRVHVTVPSRDLGARVLGRLRPWLATLLAISANSPIAGGRDTGWASTRYEALAPWPTLRPPEVWPGADAYDQAVRQAVRAGSALDERGVQFLARLTPGRPEVEVRVTDTCPDAATTVLVATLTRALVATAAAEIHADVPAAPAPRPWVVAGVLVAARNGLGGMGVDPCTGRAVPAWDLLHRAVGHAGKALADLGDTDTVDALLTRLRELGTGADRQRRLWTSTAAAPAMVASLRALTVGA